MTLKDFTCMCRAAQSFLGARGKLNTLLGVFGDPFHSLKFPFVALLSLDPGANCLWAALWMCFKYFNITSKELICGFLQSDEAN